MRSVIRAAAIRCTLCFFAAAFALAGIAADRKPDLVLRDTITAAGHHTYRLVPFDVPAGVSAIEIEFDYTAREARTSVDVGLLGPGESFERAFRGWSGGNKRALRVSSIDATPSYVPGPVVPGRWNLLLGVANIRAGESAQFTAQVYFGREPQTAVAAAAAPLKAQAGWYRGDLHMHTGHSDGFCASTSGERRVPCPLFLTLAAAAKRGLDFVAVTEHNTISHVHELGALQPYFDRLLLIPGMELTTFQGHANAFGIAAPIDFRVGSREVADWNALLGRLAAQGTMVSINHPSFPSGESCMGCGWSPRPAADLTRVQAVEVVNGAYIDGPLAGIAFWHERLRGGERLTGIGGSDTHDVSALDNSPPPARLGVPTTVVFAGALSVAAILDAIRAGHVFIDTAGTPDRSLAFTARIGEQDAVMMGDDLAVRPGQRVRYSVRVGNVEGGRIEVIRDGAPVESVPGAVVASDDHETSFEASGDDARHWLRVDVRDRGGRLALIGNPIYINWEASKDRSP